MFYLYEILNEVTGQRYVGQTGQAGGWTKRAKFHLRPSIYSKKNSKLYRSIREYGPENFSISLLMTVATQEEANNMEVYFDSVNRLFEKSLNEATPGCVSEKLRRHDTHQKKPCTLIRKDGEERMFPSLTEACDFVGKSRDFAGHIRDVCNGKRITAAGFTWRWAE